MGTNEVVTIIDLICNKLGVAIEVASPMAIEVMRQYQARAMALGIMCLTGVISSIGIIWVGFFGAMKCEWEELSVLFFVCGLAGFVASFIGLVIHIGNYVAPLCGIIGK